MPKPPPPIGVFTGAGRSQQLDGYGSPGSPTIIGGDEIILGTMEGLVSTGCLGINSCSSVPSLSPTRSLSRRRGGSADVPDTMELLVTTGCLGPADACTGAASVARTTARTATSCAQPPTTGLWDLRIEMLEKLDELETRIRHDLEVTRNRQSDDKDDGASGQDDQTDEDFDKREYEIEESVWDNVLLAGLHTRGTDLVFVFLAATLNLALQTIFCLIVWQNMSDSSFNDDTLQNTLLWRIIVGHKAEHWDRLTNTSLVTRMCEFPEYTIMAAMQQKTYDNVEDYNLATTFGLPLGGPLVIDFDSLMSYLTPPVLCIICLIVWILVCVGELGQTLDMFRGILSVPRGKRTRVIDSSSGTFMLATISYRRVVLATIVVVIPKALIAITLCYLGIFYLIFTPRPEDLILNAIALQFVIEIDEFLFEHLVPKPVQRFLQNMEPLPISASFRFPQCVRDRICMRVGIGVAALVAAIALVVPTYLQAELHKIGETVRILCDGNRSFVYAMDSATGHVSTAATADAIIPSELFDRYAFHAVLQGTGLELVDTLENFSFTYDLSDSMESQRVFQMTQENFVQANNNLMCADTINSNIRSKSDIDYSMMDALFQNLGIMSCGELTSDGVECLSPVARSFCPETCLCNNAISGMLYRDGCSDECSAALDAQFSRDVAVVSAVPSACQDRAGVALAFGRYFHELQSFFIRQGYLESVNGTVEMSLNTKLLFAFSTNFQYWFDPETPMNLGQWAEVSYTNTARNSSATGYGTCKFIEFVYRMFAFDACEADRLVDTGGKIGALRSMCPKTCGYCSDRAARRLDTSLLGPRVSEISRECNLSYDPRDAIADRRLMFAPQDLSYRYREWSELSDWMGEVANISLVEPVPAFNESCALYRNYAPEVYSVSMQFCQSDVGLVGGVAAWYQAFVNRGTTYDLLDLMSQLDVVLPRTTTTTTSRTGTSTTRTTTTTTSSTVTTTSTTGTYSTTTTTTTFTTSTSTTTTSTTTSTTTTLTSISATTITESSTATATSTTTSSTTASTITTLTSISATTTTSTSATSTSISSTMSITSSITQTSATDTFTVTTYTVTSNTKTSSSTVTSSTETSTSTILTTTWSSTNTKTLTTITSRTQTQTITQAYYRYTPCNEMKDTTLEYLDRHTVECLPSEAMSSFQVVTDVCSDPDKRFKYSCIQGVASATSLFYTPCDQMQGRYLEHLDRHAVSCQAGSALVSFQVVNEGCLTAGHMRFRYYCMQGFGNMPSGYNTSCDLTTGERLQFLDRHNVECPADGVLVSFRLSQDGCSGRDGRILYTCATTQA